MRFGIVYGLRDHSRVKMKQKAVLSLYPKIEKTDDMMKRIVVDASVMVKWIRTEKELLLEQADTLLRDTQKDKIELYAPELAKYEIGNVLVKRKLKLLEAKSSLATLYHIPINFIPETQELAEQSYTLADKLTITYYDAAYISLAQELSCSLVTENVKHLGKVSTIKVIPLAEYTTQDYDLSLSDEEDQKSLPKINKDLAKVRKKLQRR